MERFHRICAHIPFWLPTAFTLALILWLTLSPDPAGTPMPMFPGADKIVHALMFGFLAAILLFDWQRAHAWRPASKKVIWLMAAVSALTGVAVEYAQRAMALGRAFEWADMAADAVGAVIVAAGWQLLQKRWSHPV